MITPDMCIKCKGKLVCGLPSCPILNKHNFHKKISSNFKGKTFFGPSPSLFVSWKNYPNVSFSPLSVSDSIASSFSDASIFDESDSWFGKSSEEIVSMRESLIQSRTPIKISDAVSPSYEISEIQFLAMPKNPVETEVNLKKELKPNLSFDSFTAPLGPIGNLDSLKITSNSSVEKKVDYLVSDTDAKSLDAMLELFSAGFSVSRIQRLLSAGLLGQKNNRKFVPTRWGITAVDSSLSKHFVLEQIRYFPVISDFEIYHSSYLDNSFYVLLLPLPWSFEVLEAYAPNSSWNFSSSLEIYHDFEINSPSSSYASNITGAYYSARLALVEHLLKRKKQCACIVFREIDPNYKVGLGVWQIRENVRNAFSSNPMKFSSLELAKDFLKSKLSVPFSEYESRIKIFSEFNQKRIFDFA